LQKINDSFCNATCNTLENLSQLLRKMFACLKMGTKTVDNMTYQSTTSPWQNLAEDDFAMLA